MKQLIDYIIESSKLPTDYMGAAGEQLDIVDGKIRFMYTENLDRVYSSHTPTKNGNSLMFRQPDGCYIIVFPQHNKGEIQDVLKQVFKGARKISSETVKISADYPYRGTVGEPQKMNTKIEVYEINPKDADWAKFDKMSTNLWINCDGAPYGIVSIDRPYVWNKFRK